MAISRSKLTGPKEDHSCCGEAPEVSDQASQGQLKSWRSYASEGMAAFLACLCCSLPLIPLMLGMSGALAFRDRLIPYHPVFEAGAIVILLAAVFYMWRRHKRSGKPLRSFVLHMAITLSMYGLMSFVMKQFIVPAVDGANIHAGVHAKM